MMSEREIKALVVEARRIIREKIPNDPNGFKQASAVASIQRQLCEALDTEAHETAETMLSSIYVNFVCRKDDVPPYLLAAVFHAIIHTVDPAIQIDRDNAIGYGLPIERMPEHNRYMTIAINQWPADLIEFVRSSGGCMNGEAIAHAVAEWMKVNPGGSSSLP